MKNSRGAFDHWDLPITLEFRQLSHSQHFGVGVLPPLQNVENVIIVIIYQIVLKRSMVILADIFTVLLRYFQSSRGNLIIE